MGRGIKSPLLSLAGVLLLAVGCAQDTTSSKRAVLRDCQLPSDQAGTLSGRWRATPPVPLAFASGDFSDSEMQAIALAADEWNGFTRKSLGGDIFSYSDGNGYRLSTAPAPAQVCGSGYVAQGSRFLGPVVIYKRSTWDPSRSDIIAQTNFCPTPDRPVSTFNMAFMEVNYQDFFASGKRQPSLQSISTHELGHLLGLNHSCDAASQGTPGMPFCGTSPRTYQDAVMFPVIQFAGLVGAVRNDLNTNDQGRTNCLYMGLVNPSM